MKVVAKEEVVKGRSYVSSVDNHVGRGGGETSQKEAERSEVNNVCLCLLLEEAIRTVHPYPYTFRKSGVYL